MRESNREYHEELDRQWEFSRAMQLHARECDEPGYIERTIQAPAGAVAMQFTISSGWNQPGHTQTVPVDELGRCEGRLRYRP